MAKHSADDGPRCQSPGLPATGGSSTELRSIASLLRLAAYHQAGHAVIGALLGARVLSAELWDGPPPGGEVRTAGLDDDDSVPSDHRVVRLLAYRLAGPIAEAIAEAGSMALQGDPGSRAATAIMSGFRDRESIDPETDHGAAARLLADHFGDNEAEAAAATDHLAMSVEGWVWDQWNAIAILAARLLRHRHLTADELGFVLSPVQHSALP